MSLYAVNGKEPVAAWIPSLDTAGNGTTTLTDLVGSNNGTLTNMDAATDSLTGAAVAQATVYASDPANSPVMAADRSTYTPQHLITSTPARVEWVVNRSLDFTASSGAAGMAIWINGELLVFWVDCTSGT